jgi:hypothetical protein
VAECREDVLLEIALITLEGARTLLAGGHLGGQDSEILLGRLPECDPARNDCLAVPSATASRCISLASLGEVLRLEGGPAAACRRPSG